MCENLFFRWDKFLKREGRIQQLGIEKSKKGNSGDKDFYSEAW